MNELREHHDHHAVHKLSILYNHADVGSYIETDPRLNLYNYTIDGIYLLTVPMVKEK
jgi:hypothetical protein